MAKLYPPYIEGTIPAFYANGSSATLTVPFSMNKAVSMSDFSGIAIKIKTVQSNEFIYSTTSNVTDIDNIKNSLKASFTINLNECPKIKIGQHYKIQIAYCDTSANRVPGYYSTVGVVKFTTRPIVKIADLAGLSSHRLTYTGVYSQTNEDDTIDMDVSEKVYEYCFNLYEVGNDESLTMVSTSNWQLHNSSTDIVNYESTDSYSFLYSLKPNRYYQVEYIVRTANGLEISSGKYTVIDKVGIPPEIEAAFVCINDFDNGYVSLKFIPNDLQNHNYANGTFVLARSSSEDNFTNWYPLLRFSLRNSDRLDQWEYKDFTIQHGLKYQYSIQQYNSKGLYSKRLYAIDSNGNKYIEPDFEDMFLYDGERQLKIRFNPKMSSFKTDLLENKVDTIGSKYPFIFRNSKVEYKEFPIAGLISYYSDEANLFINDEDLGLTTNYASQPRSAISRTKATNVDELYLRPRTTSYVAYNIAAERIFKLAVLEWLNNGQPKLFRSPTEGNYFIRLMNVSYSPEEKTGRLIHNFQATAYEIADCSYTTLNEYGIITIDEPAETQYRLRTLDLSTTEVKEFYANSAWGEEEIIEQRTAITDEIATRQTELNLAQNELYTLVLQYHLILDNNSATQEEKLALFNQVVEKQQECNNLDNTIRNLEQQSIKLANITSYKKYNPDEITEYIEFRDCLPGTIFYIYDLTAGEEIPITIGVTGSYVMDMEDHTFTSIRVGEDVDEPPFGLVTYKYLALVENNFEEVYDIDYEQIVARQFIGPEVIVDTRLSPDKINDIKRTLISFYYTNFKPRIVEQIYKDNVGDLWKWNENGNSLSEKKGIAIDYDKISPLMIYQVHTDLNAWEYAQWKFNPITNKYNWEHINNIDYTITIDNEVLELRPEHEEELLNHLISFFNDQSFDYLKIGNGIILDCAYTTSIVTYNIEQTDEQLQAQMRLYLNLLEMYNDSDNDETYQSEEFYQSYLVPQWERYCELLKQKLQE